MRAYGTPHALIFPIYDWSLTHIERSFFAALLKERGRRQLTGCFRPFLTCAKRRACGFSAGPSTLMRKIGFLLSFCGGVFGGSLFFRNMTRKEIFCSASVLVGLNIVLGIFTYATQHTFTFFTVLWSELTEWDSVFSQILFQFNVNEWVSAVITWVLPPYIFLLFGKKEVHTE